MAPQGSFVTLYIATGVYGDVPNLSGLSFADAKTYAKSQGFTVMVAGEAETNQAAPGTVVSQNPKAGTRARRVDPLTIYLAKAPGAPSAIASATVTVADTASSTP